MTCLCYIIAGNRLKKEIIDNISIPIINTFVDKCFIFQVFNLMIKKLAEAKQ